MKLSWGGRTLATIGEKRADPQMTIDQYLSFFYSGLQYGLIPQTLTGNNETIGYGFEAYVQGAYKGNGVVFACMLARMLLFSEVRFQWRRFNKDRVPSDLWGSPELGILEHPWQNATTGDLLARAIQDVDLAGNFFAVRRGNQIKRLRPDWMTIVAGSQGSPDIGLGDLGTDVLGYLYHPGGYSSREDPIPLNVGEVAHFAPIPDPTANYRGMSWLTPVIREIMGDSAAREHKLKFFENGATVNMVVTLDPSIQQDAFDRWVKVFQLQHEGVQNAYRTLYLGGGATVGTPVGSTFEQMQFKVTQGAGETRIAAAARVPPIIAGFSEGLAAATYANYGQARRAFADHTIRPLWRNFCGSMATIMNVPGGSELWYDDRDVAFLKEDQKDAAMILQTNAASVASFVTAGFDPDSAVEAVTSGDLSKLVHTGLYSVQLQPPGLPAPNPTMQGPGDPVVAPPAAPADEPDPSEPPKEKP